METVNNLTSAASRAIWGDSSNTSNTETTQTQNETQGREPLSGETGDVAAGEPYDKGNAGTYFCPFPLHSSHSIAKQALMNILPADSTTTEPTAPSPTIDSTSNPTSTTDSTANPTSKSDIPNNPIRSEHDTDKTGVTSIHNPTSATSSDKPTSSTDTSVDPASGQQDTQKQQGADRPTDSPSSDEHSRIKEAKREAEDAQNVDVSGPGPRTLEERAKEGGNTSGSTAAGSEGDDDGPQKESKGEGTGEKYIKSSGMKADGGDFDASNPGAGREADREFVSFP